MERLGIIGRPNAGKSSLFNALTGGSAVVAPHPFSTTETHVGVAQVPDHRLLALSEMSHSRKTVRDKTSGPYAKRQAVGYYTDGYC